MGWVAESRSDQEVAQGGEIDLLLNVRYNVHKQEKVRESK
jgi:hypothetical protein